MSLDAFSVLEACYWEGGTEAERRRRENRGAESD